MRNAFFPIMGDVLAIFLSAATALVAEGNKDSLTYSAIVWIMLNILIITFAFYYTGHYSMVFKMISAYEVVKLIIIVAIVSGINVLFATVTLGQIISFKGVLIFMVYTTVTTVALLILRKIVFHLKYSPKT